MLTSRRGMVLSLTLSALISLAGCGGKPETPGVPDNGTKPETPAARKPAKVLIGVLLPTTGPDAAKGQAVLMGLKLAVKQKGGPLGLDESSFEIKDCGQTGADVVALARGIIDVEGANALVGPLDEKSVEAIEEFGRQKQVPIFTPASGAMKLGQLDCTVRRLTFTDEEEGAAMAELAYKKGWREASALVDVASAAAQARVVGFADRFQRLGGHVLPQVSYSAGDKDFSVTLRRAGFHRPAPDVYYLAGARAESAAILEEMKAQKTFGAVLGSSEWTKSPNFVEGSGEFPVEVSAASTVLVPCRFFAASTEGATAEFVRTLKAGYQREPDAYTAFGYDAGLVIIDALMRGPSTGLAAGGSLAERVGTTKLLPGASGRLTARTWSVAGQVTLLRLKGTSFEFDSVVEVK